MCGRYYIEIDDKELQDICEAVMKRQHETNEQLEIKLSGEIFPSNIVPAQTGPYAYSVLKWGFTGYDGRLVINARSETAFTKPMFRESMQRRRCLIPASGYYEWQHKGSLKTKYQFYTPRKPLYLAGCFRHEKDSPVGSFVILTRDAKDGLQAIHERMPVIVPKGDIESWLSGAMEIRDIPVEKLSFERAAE